MGVCDLEMSNVITDKTSQDVQGPMSNLKCLSVSFEPLEEEPFY